MIDFANNSICRAGGWVVGIAVVFFTISPLKADQTGLLLKSDAFKHYIDEFNKSDEELYANISNADAWRFLWDNVPVFNCPDTDLERTYYFRWWTYRKTCQKHIRWLCDYRISS